MPAATTTTLVERVQAAVVVGRDLAGYRRTDDEPFSVLEYVTAAFYGLVELTDPDRPS